jgi:uncharacterized membrane protein YedE/YeeE
LVPLYRGCGNWLAVAFATTDKHLAITLQYEHIAALAEKAVVPEIEETNRYFEARREQGLAPVVGWYMMLILGVLLGAFLSSWLSGDRSQISVPRLWAWRFGPNVGKRLVFAFLGGAIMVFGARLAGGCTSGHGISGTLQLAVQSWTFILLAFTVAIATAFLMFGREGRSHV